MKGTTMELDELLRETATVAEPAPALLRAAWDAPASPEPADVVRRRSSTRSRRRRFGVLAAVAAAATVVLVVGPAFDLGGRPGASADAASVLLAAGAAAGEQPGGWADAAYWHSVAQYRDGDGPVTRREVWIGHRDSGMLVDRRGAEPLEVGVFFAGGSALSWDDLYRLPTDPAALERQLRAGIHGAGPDDDTELFTIVGDLLRESPAPPALRRALWEVAAGIPGVGLVGPLTDAVGRPGVAIERAGQRYLLDPDDGRLLEESHGSWRSTYLEQGPASTVPASTVPPLTPGG